MTHKLPRLPFTGSGRKKEGGFLATHRQDFNAHHTGTDYRHGADDVDMNLPIEDLNGIFKSQNVQNTIEKITSYLENLGSGFILGNQM